jgi:hypothetical protein
VGRALPELKRQASEEELTQTLLDLHRRHPDHGKIAGHLALFDDLQAKFRFYKRLLAQYARRGPLAQAMAAGKVFADDPATAAEYNTLAARYEEQVGTDTLLNILRPQARAAAAAGDLETWRAVTGQVQDVNGDRKELLKRLHLNENQLTAMPELPRAKSRLLSADGLLKLSSHHGAWDRPILGHPRILRHDPIPGWLNTDAELQPAATVVLPAPCTLTSVQIMLRFDLPQDSHFPMSVMVSEDGNEWETLETITEYKDQYNFDWSASPPSARYVKVEGDYRESNTKRWLQLRRILVNGVPSY